MPIPVRSTAASLHVFLDRIIDYAGQFAPASLDMRTSVGNYLRYLNDPKRWALGRFVLPVARLDEFLNLQGNSVSDPWHLSGIVSANIEAELAAVDEFNRKAPGAVMDTIEVRVCSIDMIELVRRNQPAGTIAMFEISADQAGELLPVLCDFDGRGSAKLRTGGVTEEAFPAVEQIAEFVARCAELGVPFKATAGLHHPLRCIRALTYEANSRKAMMHGFLNLFTAAAIARSAVLSGGKAPRVALARCLADEERADWHFDEEALTWSGGEEPIRIELEVIRSVRSKFALSFGSCSFEEPMLELREIGLL